MARRIGSTYFFTLVLGGCMLIAVLLLPYIAQQIVFSTTRGAEQARLESALAFFAKNPQIDGDSSWVAPWVVRLVGPSVVGVKTLTLGNDFAPAEAEGSGVIVDASGYILTNFHVVIDERLPHIVRLSDGRETSNVRVIGYDKATDLAVLKIDLTELSAIEWGDSDAIEVGAPVLALGNPYGFAHTVTKGIISAKERFTAGINPSSGQWDQLPPQEYMQTDAAINPGSSGGPLVDLFGKLIGINTAIFGESFRGISLAVPSTLAKKVYEEIRTHGNFSHGWIGVSMEPLMPQFARRMGLPERSGGVFINFVLPNSPAEKAGIQRNDVIVSWNGTPVSDPTKLSHLVILTRPETEATLGIVRDREPQELKITVGTRAYESRQKR